ncbi:hypothetical protein MsAg5_16070 [Methanosarcinaceae archaeon Ag5]|uniref:Uncharacterized protein n=1 Tax=Methanolapillus africanus TaxID=3028297 RepID=A0AAE4MKT1_9EURY|nr:hypothetical protein [Methanosarcinaceae archaeon Ag5]
MQTQESKIKWFWYVFIIGSAFIILFSDVLSAFFWGMLAEQFQLSKLATSCGAHITTIMIWIVGSYLLLNFIHKKFNFNLFKVQTGTTKRGILLCIILVVLVTVFMFVLWGGFKPWLEYQSAITRLGAYGWVDFILQNIYYIFEMLVCLILVAFGQKAGEAATSLNKIPWGGLLLGIIWGLPHALTKGDLTVGLSSFAIGIILGLPYILLNRNAGQTWAFMAFMFIL